MIVELIKTNSVAENIELICTIIQSIATTIALILGGIWAYYKFWRQRENNALTDFSVDIIFHSLINDYWIIEIVAFVENKGKVQHKIFKFDFKLEGLKNTDQLIISTNEELERGQIKFKIIKEGSFMRIQKNKKEKKFLLFHKNYSLIFRKNNYYFIEPGLKNKYSYVTLVPKDYNTLLLHSWFEYPHLKHGHIAEVTIKVPQEI